jgi:hypothetical protein
MKRIGLLLMLGALLSLSGCPSEEEECLDCPVPCERPPAPFMPEMPGLIRVGQRTEIRLQNALLGMCGGKAVSEKSTLTAEVTDPDGVLLAKETFDERLAIAVFAFTPRRPGPHHFLVAFEPPGALLQFDLDAAIDRSSTTQALTLPGTCNSLERTLKGTWVCDSAIYREGLRVGSFDGATVAVAGDVVWVVSPSRVERYEDTGSALTLTASVEPTEGSAEFLLASGDELLVLHRSTLVRYTASGAQLLASPPVPWNSGEEPVGPLAPRGLLLRDRDQLAVISGKSQLDGPGLQLCPYQLTASGPLRIAAPCQEFLGLVAGFEPAALWTKRHASRFGGASLHRWSWEAGRLVEQTSLNLSFRLQVIEQPLVRSTALPVVRSLATSVPATASVFAVATWSEQWRSLVFEHLDAELTEPLASPSFYWGRLPSIGSSSTRIRPR